MFEKEKGQMGRYSSFTGIRDYCVLYNRQAFSAKKAKTITAILKDANQDWYGRPGLCK